jgi:peptidyl-prolyl cis-trans isomerase D
MAEPDDIPPPAPRSSFRQLAVWLVLGIIAIAFGIQFGLPTESISFGPEPIARVHGESIRDEDFAYEMNALPFVAPIPGDDFAVLMGLRQEVLDAVVERILLAHVAASAGLSLETRDAEELTARGFLIVLGETRDVFRDKPFDYEIFAKALLPQLQVSEPRYLEIQRQELLARTLRDLATAGTGVGEGEVRTEYERRANKVSLRYVRYTAAAYAPLVDPTAEQLAAYVEKHRTDLEAKFDTQAKRFQGLPKQARVRVIQVPGDDDASKTAITAAKQRVDRGEDFRRVARAVSKESSSARAGGEWGWVSLDDTSGLDPAVVTAATGLEVGATSAPVQGADGWWLVHVAGIREGDVSKEDALVELAEQGLALELGRSLAKQSAEEALLALKNGKTMDDLFAAPDALGAGGIEDLGTATDGEPTADERPQMRSTGSFGKGKTIPGLGAMPDLAKAVWDETQATNTTSAYDRLFETADGWLVVGIEKRETATDEGYATQRAGIWRELRDTKAREVSARWAWRTCLDAKARGAIVPNEKKVARVMTYSGEAGELDLPPYSMCERVGNRGGALNAASRLTAGGDGT